MTQTIKEKYWEFFNTHLDVMQALQILQETKALETKFPTVVVVSPQSQLAPLSDADKPHIVP